MEKKQKLWEKLSSDGRYTKSYEEFDAQFSTPESISKLHSKLNADGLYTKPFEEFNAQFFQAAPAEVKKKESASALPSQGLPGSPVSGGQQKTVSQPTVEVGVPGGQQVPAAKPVVQTPPVSGGVAKPAFGDDLIKSVAEKPTEELVWNYMKGVVEKNDNIFGTRTDITLEALPKDRVPGVVKAIDAVRKRTDLSNEEKVIESQRLIQKAVADQAFVGEYVSNDIAQREALLEKSNPDEYKKILAKRTDDAFNQSGLKDRNEYDARLMYSAIDQGVGLGDFDPEAKEEAKLLVQRGLVAGKDLEYLKSDPKAYETMKVKRDATLADLDARIGELRDIRLTSFDERISELSDAIVSDPSNEALKKERAELIKGRDQYLDPSLAEAKVMGQYNQQIKEQKGETPREKLKNYYLSLEHQRREIERQMPQGWAEKAITKGLQATVAGTDPMTKRYNQIVQRMNSIAPVVLFNQRPVEQGAGESLARQFADVWGGVGLTNIKASDAQVAGDILESMTAAGISPEDVSKEAVEKLRKDTEGYGLNDPRFYTGMGGMLAGIGLQAMAGGSATKGIQAPKWIAQGPKLLKTVFNMAKQGAAYEITGEVFKDSEDEFDFVSGMAGGAAGKLMETGGNVSGKLLKNLGFAFGENTPKAVEIITRVGKGAAGGALGELPEETIQDLWHVYRDTGSFKQFMEEHDTWSENLKYFVGISLMGGAMGAGTAFGQGANDAAAEAFNNLSPEEQTMAREYMGETLDAIEDRFDEVGAQQVSEPVAADQTVDTNAIQDKFGVTLQLNTETGETEVVANEGTTPDQVEAAKAELSKGGVNVGENEKRPFYESYDTKTFNGVDFVSTGNEYIDGYSNETRFEVNSLLDNDALQDKIDLLEEELSDVESMIPEYDRNTKEGRKKALEAYRKAEKIEDAIRFFGGHQWNNSQVSVTPPVTQAPSTQAQTTAPVTPDAQAPVTSPVDKAALQTKAQEIGTKLSDDAAARVKIGKGTLTPDEREALSDELDGITKQLFAPEAAATTDFTIGEDAEMSLAKVPEDIDLWGASEEDVANVIEKSVVTAQEPTVAPESKAATAPESQAKAYDFDNTLYDPKTGQLTPLGEEVKARIAAGEKITIVTARNGKQTAAITKALGISKDKIQATGDEAKKGEVLDRLGIAREDYYDADQAKMEAIQGRVPAAPEATMEPTAPVTQAPVAPATQTPVAPQAQVTPVQQTPEQTRKEAVKATASALTELDKGKNWDVISALGRTDSGVAFTERDGLIGAVAERYQAAKESGTDKEFTDKVDALLASNSPAVQAPVTPTQKPAVEPTPETQGKTQPQSQAAPTAPVSTGEVTFNVKSKFDDAVDTFTGNILSESRDSFGNKKFTIEAEVDGKLEKFFVAEKDIVSRKEAAAEQQAEETGKKFFSIGGQDRFFHASDNKRRGRLKPNNAPQFGTAVYFGSNKERVEYEFGDENTTEAYLDLKNPVFTNSKEWVEVEDIALDLANADWLNKNRPPSSHDIDEDGPFRRYDTRSDIAEIPSRFISDAAKQLGYDAIVDTDTDGQGTYGSEIAVLDESTIVYDEDLQVEPTQEAVPEGKPESKTKKAARKVAKAASDLASSGVMDDSRAEAKKIKALLDAVAELGVAVMEDGITEIGAWMQRMKELTPQSVHRLINDKGYAKVKADFEKASAASTTGKSQQGKQAAAEPEVEEEGKKEPDNEPKKSGTQKLLEKHIESVGVAIREFIGKNPLTKTPYDQKEQYNAAEKEVQNAIKKGTVQELVTRLTQMTSSDIDQFQRMILGRTFGAAIDSAVDARNKAELSGDKAEADRLNKAIDSFRENMVLMIEAMSANATNAGRIGAASAYWKMVAAGLDSYAMTAVERLNRSIRENRKTSNGKTVKEVMKTATDAANEARKNHADDIADKTVQQIDQRIESSGKSKGKKILGMTKADAEAGLKKAIEEYNNVRVGGGLSTGGLAGSAAYIQKMTAAAKVGYYVLANGAFKFADWASAMRKSIPGLSDDDLQTIWETEISGVTLKDESARVSAEIEAPKMIPQAKAPAKSDAEKQELKEAKETRAKVRETIRDHFKKPDGRGLQEKLIEAGLGLAEAEAVIKIVDANAQQIMKDSIDGAFDHIESGLSRKKARLYKDPKKSPKRSNAEILISKLVDGDLSDKYIEGLVGHRFGMGKMPSPEQVARLREIGKAIDAAETGGVIHNVIVREAAKIFDEIMPWDKGAFPKAAEIADIMHGLTMASLLSSPETLVTNLHSITDHFFTGWAKALVNPLEWVHMVQVALKTGSPSKALYSSPLGKTLVKMSAGGKPVKNGWNAFWSGMKTGVISSKYDENVMDGNIEKQLGSLERQPKTRFGKFLIGPWSVTLPKKGKDGNNIVVDVNPASWITGKIIGKVLSATDAANTLMYADYEFMDAIRWAAGKNAKSWGEMMSLVNEYRTENSPEWLESYAQAQEEADIAAKAGVVIPERTIKVRAREIMRPKIAARAGISREELNSIQKVAQYNTLTLNRGGTVAKVAKQISTWRDSNVFAKIALTPFFLFTQIPANYAEALADNTPIVNLFRLFGLTGMDIRRKQLEKKGVIKTSERFWESTSMQDRAYRKMFEQVVASNMLMYLAYSMMAARDDDDEGKPNISIKENEAGSDYMFEFNIPFTDTRLSLSYKNFPFFAPAMLGAKIMSDYDKSPAGKMDKESGLIAQTYGRTLAMSMALGSFYTDQSFMKGSQDAMRMVQAFFQMTSGEGTRSNFLKSVVRPYMNLAVKPLWTAQGVTRFVRRLADNSEYKSETFEEMFMSAVGLEFVTNEKAVDLFGREKTIPLFKNIINIKQLGDQFGWSEKDPNNDLYRFLSKTNTIIDAPKMQTIKIKDETTDMGFAIRKMTTKEQVDVVSAAGLKFAKDLRSYMNSSQYKQSKDDVAISGERIISKVQEDILKIWSKARSDAKEKYFKDKLFTESEVEDLLNNYWEKFIHE